MGRLKAGEKTNVSLPDSHLSLLVQDLLHMSPLCSTWILYIYVVLGHVYADVEYIRVCVQTTAWCRTTSGALPNWHPHLRQGFSLA